ncbi:MAG: hypothetical protein ACYDER_17435 [Ktedonobacteraceae bacterium]
MASEIHSAFVNYYEYLNVPQDSDTAEIEEALEKLTVSFEAQLNNPLTMNNARQIINEVLPAIRQCLLSGVQVRAEYDRQLLEAQRKLAHRGELADDEGLDDPLRQPFFFDPFEEYDTEMPAFSLRQIAMKLDEEWEHTRTWFTDTSNEMHVFVGFLIHVAGREHLAKRIEQIITAVARQNGKGMEVNEAIERCIYILDPQVERPVVDIHNDTFDGRVLHAGDFISDQPAQSVLILENTSLRGCVFGAVESRTDWLRFGGGQSSVHFSLMPEGTDARTGLSQVKIPLHFQINRLERNTEYTAQLLLRIENHEPPVEVTVGVHIFVKPLPPRVSFEPPATRDDPAWAGLTLCGTPGRVVVMPHNSGDEELVHLTARLSTTDQAASSDPALFYAEKPITFTIDTRNRKRGEKYDVIFQVDYSASPEALGPRELHVQGEMLPTTWQSMLRQRPIEERIGWGCGGSVVGLVLFGLIGTGLALHAGIAWLLFLALPALFTLAVRPIAATIVTHIQRSGNTSITFEKVPAWVLWWLPLGVGLALALLCLFLPGGGTGFLIAGIVGGIVGLTAAFIADQAGKKKTKSG